jgi:hypothetical protein
MFTMNNLTVKFFETHFNVKISQYLELSEAVPVQTYGIRENPLSYSLKLNRYGFRQEKIDFFTTTMIYLEVPQPLSETRSSSTPSRGLE